MVSAILGLLVKARAWAWLAPWALVAAGMAGTLWYRDAYHGCRLEQADALAGAEKAKADALADAQRRSDAIIAKQRDVLRDLAERAASVQEKIRVVPVTTVCADSPAVRLGIDGMRELIRPGGGPAKAVGSAPAPLQ